MPTLVDPWGGVTQGLTALQETIRAIPQMQAAKLTLAELYENRKIRSEIGIASQEAQAKYQRSLFEYNTEIMGKYKTGLEQRGNIGEPIPPEPKKPDFSGIAEGILEKHGRWEEAEQIKSHRQTQQFAVMKLMIDAADSGQDNFAKWIAKGNRDLFGDEAPDLASFRKVSTDEYEAIEEETGIKHIITVKRDANSGEFIGVEDIKTIKVAATPEEKMKREVETTKKKKEAELEVEKRFPKELTPTEEANLKGKLRDDARAYANTTVGLKPEFGLDMTFEEIEAALSKSKDPKKVKEWKKVYVEEYNRLLKDEQKRKRLTFEEPMEVPKDSMLEEGYTKEYYDFATGTFKVR